MSATYSNVSVVDPASGQAVYSGAQASVPTSSTDPITVWGGAFASGIAGFKAGYQYRIDITAQQTLNATFEMAQTGTGSGVFLFTTAASIGYFDQVTVCYAGPYQEPILSGAQAVYDPGSQQLRTWGGQMRSGAVLIPGIGYRFRDATGLLDMTGELQGPWGVMFINVKESGG